MPCHPPEDLEDLSQLLHTYNLVTLSLSTPGGDLDHRPRPQPSASVKRSHRLTSSWSSDVMPPLRLDGHIRFTDSTLGPLDTEVLFTSD